MYYLMTEYFTQKSFRPYSSTFVITEGRRIHVKRNMPICHHQHTLRQTSVLRATAHILNAMKCGYQLSTIHVNGTLCHGNRCISNTIGIYAHFPKNLGLMLILKSGTGAKECFKFNINNIFSAHITRRGY